LFDVVISYTISEVTGFHTQEAAFIQYFVVGIRHVVDVLSTLLLQNVFSPGLSV
jgi:hypothetical protein